MRQKGITIVPTGGLANRMRVVVSALHIADEKTKNVHIVWHATKECNARWEDLFLPFQKENVILSEGMRKNSIASKRNLWLPKLCRSRDYDKQIECYNPSEMPIETLCDKYDALYISTCYALCDYDSGQLSKIFYPKEELQKNIANVTSLFAEHTLGVHIRRKDNKQAIMHSPLSDFHHRMDKYLAEYPDAKIFLCTDDASVKRHFRQIFKERMITTDAELQRNTLTGMQDAVVDLWCLAATSLVVGSYYSSFSDTATELGGQPLEIINV